MLVTVITTCFNEERTIEKTVKSVLSQNFTDYEYIIMDGASTDNTVSIAKLYEKRFEEKHVPFYVFSQRDRGIYDGMNHGVNHARGEFIIFMNANDTFYDENVLARVFYNTFANDTIDFSSPRDYTGIGLIYGDAAELEYGKLYYFPKNIRSISRRMPFSHQTVFARRELVLKYPFNLEYRIVADYDFIMNLVDEQENFADCGEMIAIVTKDGVSSRDIYNTFVETENMLTKHGCPRYTQEELQKKLKWLKLKQLGMDYLPDKVKEKIRLWQRKQRGQDKTL